MSESNQEIDNLLTEKNIPSMDDFKDELNKSFRTVKEGDFITGTIISLSETDIVVDLGYYAEGIIKASEASNDPDFSIQSELSVGDTITALIITEDDGQGNILLSLKQANSSLAWDKLKCAMKDKIIYDCKIKETVRSGLITYIEGIRGFIPASQITTAYVEDLEAYKGQIIQACIITIDSDKNKLVLSGREIEYEKQQKEQKNKISSLQVGLVTTGTVETIMPYGAFVKIGNGLSGLVHISQICGKYIKSPKEVISEGEEVTVKIIDIKNNKISLSIKAVKEQETIVEDVENAPAEYIDNSASVSTNLGSLLSKFTFD